MFTDAKAKEEIFAPADAQNFPSQVSDILDPEPLNDVAERNVYACPAGKLLHTTGRIHDGETILYRARTYDWSPSGQGRLVG